MEGDAVAQAGIDVATTAGIVVFGALIGLVLAVLLQRTLFRVWQSGTSAALLDRPRWPGRLAGAIFGAVVAVEFAALDAELSGGVDHLLQIVLVVALAAFLINTINGLVEGRLRIGRDLRDPAHRRRVTQLRMLRRVGIMLVVVVAAALILVTFEPVRAIGTSLLASAGVLGVIVGVAAQGTLGNVFAGIQIAFSEPLAIDDDVVIEGEWGTVEEITLTHVVVRLWDWRRLVLPTSYFLETPFQNWTKNDASLIGAVMFHLDFRVPLDELREVAGATVAASPHHDGEVFNVQVVDSHEHTMQVRVLASAADAPSAWDLRCEVREAVFTWLVQDHPEALPTLRIDDLGPGADVG